MKDIRNYNSKRKYHGYQEWYFYGNIFHRGNWKNDDEIGYIEWHGNMSYFENANETCFYI